MSTDFDFEDFLRHGRIGPLHLGCSLDEVLDFLGTPDQISVRNAPKIMKYRSLQLTFTKNDILAMMVFSFFPYSVDWHPRLNLVGKIPRPGMSVDDFFVMYKSLLKEIIPNTQLTFNNQKTFTIKSSNIDILFMENILERAVCSSLEFLREDRVVSKR